MTRRAGGGGAGEDSCLKKAFLFKASVRGRRRALLRKGLREDQVLIKTERGGHAEPGPRDRPGLRRPGLPAWPAARRPPRPSRSACRPDKGRREK